MLINTKDLTAKQLCELYLAVFDLNHAAAAERLEINIYTFRDMLRGTIKCKREDAIKARIEVELMRELGE